MALGWLGDFLGINKGEATKAAADQNAGIVQNLGTQGGAIIDKGAKGAGNYLQQILGMTGLGGGSTLYGDALGANGAEGSARALDAFTTSPGYQFQLDQGLQALDRRAAAEGRFSSGSAEGDTQKFAQGLASQDWNQWLANLTGGVDRATGALTDLANLSTGTATAKLGLAGDVAGGLTSANNQRASGAEANQGWGMNLLSNGLKLAGGFAGYGGF